MPDTLAITIISIIVCTVLGAFIRGKLQDKCLKDFSGNTVNLEATTGKIVCGKLSVENTGLELVYTGKHKDEVGTSYILYKYEYPTIQALVRYHNELDEDGKKKRERELKRTYHPSFLKRLKRRIQNFFKTVKDSLMDVVNLLIGRVKAATPVGGLLTSQGKYTAQIKQELVGFVGTAFEPLLERHIGKKIILELAKGDKTFEYPGVLKDYTTEFIEIMDVDYRIKEDQITRKADLIVPRKYGVIRHLDE
ncbi:MAG: hypothetical protein COZ37_06475 [bacterium (Candidatus Ratteibacteria) CG_4_10_14_3_um_filter_41_18]|uniref:Uncharacterized protein n=4 Tax=Candidatus Ratteibacteria TaxID=2979319 RepID=A0A2M7YGH8_9BACT|nr:MAG: hypothetical protein COS11_01980 [bacterium (Candidatus Ratteibacteria) CG01_land_8_20_14_3_00_40_19]PIW34013.1 MAG: hypothetical protein COW28_01510 [bacterium (Candidatus Ratteibacteria) CG15_BIG_FIL_POST_REV_8_21_14_020_41_12]PIW73704.1 MAG: hypothetical protein CO004_04545 [bacterium (Candidatus Ratteibacteria) CG_4_8_14_3_um_filter_41_36]PIX76708.1 MAG: hypothetical protein COZ37_06475 [bacterium (Candidatus Ratteibacteria) CG_4_10_14_3_um_filter_41_18]PJA62066.1 MAG: hypothetical 